MNELKPVERTLRILQKINEGDTGSRDEFAQYIGITPRNLTLYIRKIEQVLKLQVLYNRKRSTYFISKSDGSKIPPPQLFKIILNLSRCVGGCVAIPNQLIFVN